jgi:hypothetical protein
MEVSDQFHAQTALSTGKEPSVSIAWEVQYLLPFPGIEPVFLDHIAVQTGTLRLTLRVRCVTCNDIWHGSFGLVLTAWKQVL